MQRQLKPRRRRRKRTNLSFESDKVFRPVGSKDDLTFDLEREAALYKASKGQGGNRQPPYTPPAKEGGGYPGFGKRWSV